MKSFILKLLKGIKQKIKNKLSFTLTEMLIAVGILAVLSVTVLLTLNPQDLIKQSRDSQRLSDLTNLSKAISLYEADTGGKGFMGTSSVVYVSIPDTTSTCANLGLPKLPSGWSYHCVSSSTLQNIDGTGWIPINFNNLSFGKTLPKLPIDPINTVSSGNYYTYTYDNGVSKYELNANLESSKYKQQLAINDGGDNPSTYEISSNLSITPNINTFINVIENISHMSGVAISQTSDGGYVMGGNIYNYGAGGLDAFIIKLNSSGNIEWAKAMGGSNYDDIGFISQTSDGGYIAGGRTTSYGAGDSDAFIIKLNSSGNIQWSKTIGGSNDDSISSIFQTSDGGYIAVGYTTSYGAGFYDVFIIKLNSSGNIEWAKAMGGSNYDDIGFISQTSDGGYIAGGWTTSYGAGDSDAFIIKLNSSGNIQWSKTIGGSNDDSISSISQTSDGNYIISGFLNDIKALGDLFISKLDSSGNISNCSIIQSVNPQISSISPTVTSPSPTVNSVSPTVTSPSPTVTSLSFQISNICPAQ
jgi:type II secretory pathway pseudopilin PulG